MDGIQSTDPLLWDVSAVANELCHLSRPCTRNPEILAAKLQENEIDGHTLLTYDLVGLTNAHGLRNELFQLLHVQSARHKNALGEAIMKLRARSPAFRQWKLDNLEISSHEECDVRSRDRDGSYSTQMTPQFDLLLPWTTPRNPFSKMFPSTPLPLQVVDQGRTLHTPALSMLGTDSGRAHDTDVSAAPMTESLSLPSGVSPVVDANSPVKELKRKRVAPELIQKEPLNTLPAPIATEADIISSDSLNSYPWDTADAFAYLGPGAISQREVKSNSDALTLQIEGEGDALCTPAPTRFPPGRRLAINKIMRRVLVENGKKIAMADAGVTLDALRQSSTEGDKVLDLDDIPDEVDEETLREMEAEKTELAQMSENLEKSNASKSLSQDRVRQLLDESVLEMTKNWTEKKKPKYQNKANALWVDASRRGAKKHRILEARAQAKFYDERIKKLEGGILKQTWEKEKQVRFQARLLEQNVEDKLYQCWLADTLESRLPPPKPISLPRRSVTRPKRTNSELSDGEVLTSSDEDAFIVDDEPIPPVTPIKEARHAIPSKVNRTPSPILVESPVYIDLTQTASTRASSPVKWSTKVVDSMDLDTPTKVRPDSTPIIKEDPSGDESVKQPQASSWAEKYRDVEKIISFPISHWTKEKERFALTITLLWKLGHLRRSAIFEHVRVCEAHKSFKATVLKHISDPLKNLDHLRSTSPESLAFDVSRLFLCFLKIKNLKETRLADLKPSQITKLKAKENHSSWNIFHAFLKKMAPLFPKDNQIYREEELDDDEVLGDDAGEDETSLLGQAQKSKPPRKAALKEIVRNKEAVDIREREIRRQEEQESRRLRLRANLGINGQIASDKSRLIINESKQDDQSFIYINNEIGPRIKDHQIDGVRFMWNQIIQDSELRQGCLLSHSMGLGKTMQVITLLVAIQESSKSSDKSIVSQIPEDLRRSKTLVTCPAGLVNNWVDEILIWDNDRVLGDLHAIDSTLSIEERLTVVQEWSQMGGVLVIGYPMLRKVSDELDKDRSLLSIFDEPNIVIADEAHALKNPKSRLNLVCSRFRATSRIAMTGSPLANNIEEYYFMINWVAPNFLGPVEEFREIYSNPIQSGVDIGSSGVDKRKALKKLEALKQIVAPKVHRATVNTCMQKDLPPKQEFVICVKPKPLQAKLYNLFVQIIRGESVGDIQGEAELKGAVFRVTNDLTLLCNHPHAFYEKAIESQDPPKGESKPRAGLPPSIIPAVLAEFARIETKSPSLSTKVELLIQILDDAKRSKDKVLVFSHSIPTLNYLSKLFEEQKRHFSRLDGKTPIAKRQDEIKKFNANHTEVYLISTRAGGVGLNIQGANKVVILDSKWNPVHEQQAIGRSYRIGQSKPVSVYHFVTAGTFEQDLHGRAIFKTQLATRVVDKKNPISWGNRVTELKHDIKEIRKENLTQFLKRDSILDRLIAYGTENGAIRKIMSTETFEEEDAKAPLSAEEQKEANDMAALNGLRMKDPEEYKRRQREMEEGQFRRRHASYMEPSSSSSKNNGTVPDVRRTLDGATDIPMGVTSSIQTQPQPQAPAPPAPPGSIIESTVLPPSTSAPEGTAVSAPFLLPILGAHTYFGKDKDTSQAPQAKTQQEVGQTRPVSGSPSSTAKHWMNPFISQIKNPGKAEFKQKLYKKLETIPDGSLAHLDTPRSEIVEKVIDSIDAIRRGRGFGFLPDNQHWRALGNFVEQDRFVWAVMSGQLEASYLALTDVGELEKYLNTLGSASSKDSAAPAPAPAPAPAEAQAPAQKQTAVQEAKN